MATARKTAAKKAAKTTTQPKKEALVIPTIGSEIEKEIREANKDLLTVIHKDIMKVFNSLDSVNSQTESLTEAQIKVHNDTVAKGVDRIH